MMLLAADTSSNRTSLALLKDGEIISMQSDGVEPSASRMYVLMDAVLRAGSTGIGDVTALALGAGPGSFTGLRVSFAALRTLAWARGIPLIPVNSLEALVWAHRALPGPIAVVQPARRGHVYQLAVRQGQIVQEVGFFSLEEARARIGELGEGVLLAGVPDDLELGLPVLVQRAGPDAAAIARIASARLAAGERPILEDVLPLYLRPSDAEVTAGLGVG